MRLARGFEEGTGIISVQTGTAAQEGQREEVRLDWEPARVWDEGEASQTLILGTKFKALSKNSGIREIIIG